MPSRDLSLGVLFTAKINETVGRAVNQINEQMDKLNGSISKTTEATQKQRSGFLSLGWSIKEVIGDMEKLIAVQMRWYGAKAVLFAAVEAPIAGMKHIIQYTNELEMARAEMLRWGATSGKVTDDMTRQVDLVMLAIRRALTEYPVALKDLSSAVQAFAGAGVPYQTLMGMVEGIAKLKVSFKEINFEQMAVAATGAYNTFGKSMKGVGSEAEKMLLIFEKLLRAQAVGIARPEQFPKVLQFLGQVTHLFGGNIDQMLAMAVAISNMGANISSVSRLARSFLLSMQSDKFLQFAKQLNIPIDKNQNIFAQLNTIIPALNKALGEGSPIAIGWMNAFSKTMGKNEIANFMAFTQQYTRYIELTKEIAESKGGLTAAFEVMAKPPSQQWVVFINLLNAVGKAINERIGPDIQKFTGTLVDIGRGLLVAMDPSGIFLDKLDKLGNAGKLAYNVMTQVINAFKNIWVALGPVVTIFGEIGGVILKVTQFLAEHTRILEFLITLIMGRLIFALGAWILPLKALGVGLTAVINGLTGWGAVLPVTAAAMTAFGLKIDWLLSKTNVAILAITSLLALKNYLDTRSEGPSAESRLGQYDVEIIKGKKTKEDYDKDIKDAEAHIAKLQALKAKTDAWDKGVFSYVPKFLQSGAAAVWTKKNEADLKTYTGIVEKAKKAKEALDAKTTPEVTGKAGPPPPSGPPPAFVSSVSNILMAIREQMKAMEEQYRHAVDMIGKDTAGLGMDLTTETKEYMDNLHAAIERGDEIIVDERMTFVEKQNRILELYRTMLGEHTAKMKGLADIEISVLRAQAAQEEKFFLARNAQAKNPKLVFTAIHPEDIDKVGELIKKYEALGMTQEQVAAKIRSFGVPTKMSDTPEEVEKALKARGEDSYRATTKLYADTEVVIKGIRDKGLKDFDTNQKAFASLTKKTQDETIAGLKIIEAETERTEAVKLKAAIRRIDETRKAEEWVISERTKATDYQYSTGIISAKDYYTEIASLIKQQGESERKEIENTRDVQVAEMDALILARRELYEQEANVPGYAGPSVENRLRDEQTKRQEFIDNANDKLKESQRRSLSDIYNLYRKQAEDLDYIFEHQRDQWEGVGAVAVKVAQRIVAEYSKAGTMIGNFFKQAADTIERTFSEVLDDALMGKLKSFEDYFRSFALSIGKAINEMSAKILTGKLLEGIGIGKEGFSGGGLLGMLGLGKVAKPEGGLPSSAADAMMTGGVTGLQAAGTTLTTSGTVLSTAGTSLMSAATALISAAAALTAAAAGKAAAGVGDILGWITKGGEGIDYSGWDLFHGGAVVGVDKPVATIKLPQYVFANAPRFHSGLQPDEFPSILKRGEGVFTPGQMQALGNSRSDTYITNLVDPRMIDSYMASPQGKRSVLNIIGAEKRTVRKVAR